MVSARINVAPPFFTPGRHGLADVVKWRSGDSHWQGGVEWENVCGDVDSTYSKCVAENAIGTGVTVPEPTVKSVTSTKSTFGATPFTLFTEIDCSAVGFYDNANAYAESAFIQNESYGLERVFWSGVVDGVTNVALPHLAANTTQVDSTGIVTVTLQMAATVTTGAPVCVTTALGLLESAFAACHRGRGYIHAPFALAPYFAQAYLLDEDDGTLFTMNGNVVVFGRGYPGTDPSGAATPGALWMYMTPEIFGYRGDIRINPPETNITRSDDTVRAIAERNYLLGYDCCLVGVPVSTACP